MTWAKQLQTVFPTHVFCGRRLPADGCGAYVQANTPRWIQARRGRVTASVRAETIALARDINALAGLAQEIRDEMKPEWRHGYVENAYTRHGHKYERLALHNIALDLDDDFVEPGLIFHLDHVGAACTPDAYFGKDVTVQVKCPYFSRNHLKMVYSKTIKRQYWYQVQFEGWMSGRQRILFASFDPRQPLATKLFTLWVPAHNETWRKFETAMGWLKELLDGSVTPVRLTAVEGIPILF